VLFVFLCDVWYVWILVSGYIRASVVKLLELVIGVVYGVLVFQAARAKLYDLALGTSVVIAAHLECPLAAEAVVGTS
jgi:hypothetical protein